MMNRNSHGGACQELIGLAVKVNMSDPSSRDPVKSRFLGSASSPVASPLFLREDEVRRGVELLYFGYTRLTKSIDDGLAAQGLGRAHHRALYFIARHPGLTVSQLLQILAITKQSLGRVLTELQNRDMIETRTGTVDRRQKLLFLTETGAALESQLFDALRERLSIAYRQAGQESVTGFWRVLEGLVPESDREMVSQFRSDSA
jgi:DNA-binding MarR family transcriptional regulator